MSPSVCRSWPILNFFQAYPVTVNGIVLNTWLDDILKFVFVAHAKSVSFPTLFQTTVAETLTFFFHFLKFNFRHRNENNLPQELTPTVSEFEIRNDVTLKTSFIGDSRFLDLFSTKKILFLIYWRPVFKDFEIFSMYCA